MQRGRRSPSHPRVRRGSVPALHGQAVARRGPARISTPRRVRGLLSDLAQATRPTTNVQPRTRDAVVTFVDEQSPDSHHRAERPGTNSRSGTHVADVLASAFRCEGTSHCQADAACIQRPDAATAAAPHLLHGEQDRVMPAALAADAATQWRALAGEATLDLFPGLGHSIDARVVRRIVEHLGVTAP
jgi:pimeloyl-ACP methyl ester carboxylesterase